MRPSGLESIRAIQAALAEVIAPRLTSAFALDSAQTLQMLLESLAGEWDSAAEQLRRDNETLTGILANCRSVLAGMQTHNESLAAIVTDIEQRLAEEADDSIAISRLTLRNNSLRTSLERALVALEGLSGEPGMDEVDAMRRSIYTHLREVASRGWSFWDVSSFRGRMIELAAAAAAGDDGSQLVE